MMQKEKKRRKILRTGLCVILAVLLLTAVGAGGSLSGGIGNYRYYP